MNKNHGDDFYKRLTPFSDFSEIGSEAHFVEVPEDWTLVLSDIRGSTKAIQSGQYKQVNLLGAAAITVFMNLAETNDVPFVFGGDGATLLVPDSLLKQLLIELQDLQLTAKESFSMDLRVAFISLRDLRDRRQFLRVAKYELSPGNTLAQFRGSAISYAEELMKSGNPLIQILSPSNMQISALVEPMAGLSCRLQPLRSTRGKILTLLCRATFPEPKGVEVINSVLKGIQLILGGELKAATPVRLENMSWPIPPRQVGNEAKFKRKGFYWLRWLSVSLWSLVSNLSIHFEFKLGAFDPKKYKAEFQLNSDFKKFDETLRMVLDCSEAQITEVLRLLADLQAQGLLVYGVHLSEEALITCLVKSPVKNQHIHFVDGADGGYAMAALQLKAQLKKY